MVSIQETSIFLTDVTFSSFYYIVILSYVAPICFSIFSKLRPRNSSLNLGSDFKLFKTSFPNSISVGQKVFFNPFSIKLMLTIAMFGNLQLLPPQSQNFFSFSSPQL